jgi:AcrR family transcriptional regulator
MSSRNGSRAGPVDEAVREGAHVVEMQRRRLLSAIVELVYEHGGRGLTVATVCARSSLSRRTFYDIFDDTEACLLAAFEDAVQRATQTVVQAAAGERRTPMAQHGWRDRVRAGLISLLSFVDDDPGAGRLLVVEALSSGESVLQARRRVLAQLVEIVEEGRIEAKQTREPPPLTAEGIVGAVLSVIHSRILARDEHPHAPSPRMVELTGPLMAMIVQPYFGSAAAQRELERPVPAAPRAMSPRPPADPFKDLSMRLTYRTVRVLASIASTPGASNKQVARAAGITDEGQTSKLLKRLQGFRLIEDTGTGPEKGMPRAWSLTERGEGVLQAVGQG